MNIGSQFPVISSGVASNTNASSARSFQANAASTTNKHLSVAPSSLSQFESVFESVGAKFARVETLDRPTQYALNMYSETQSLFLDNSKNALVGVDVFA
ncbi:hypothetical protein O1D97_08465 [Marinomonas sp. 15G1-11]|uniref:Uncharacterized protein n=1 Tax=Marinomonas phaeophyticola TaxID=3004091 RepID=A0ABT4JTM6_9GAMM|nr:hypothetical protein [Marinomonas sp. 15G1-11]MCZ2721685.1 hypothetical protein [Marinomonas sp. 15G1-11]